MSGARSATLTGGAAWLRALLVVLLIALAAPALALADDAATAVIDPGVATTDSAGTTAADSTTTDATTAESTGAEGTTAPAAEPDATTADPGTATYGADGSTGITSPIVEAPAAPAAPPAAQEPTPAPAPPAPPVAEVPPPAVVAPPTVVPPPVVVTIPTVPTPVIPVLTPTAPPATHPPTAHPPVLDVAAPIDLPLPGAAPATPEVVPTLPTGGVTAPLPVVTPVFILPPTPGDPGAARNATIPTPSIPPVGALPTPGVAAALGIPNTPPGPTIAPPEPPLGALIGPAAGGFPPNARHYLSDLANGLLTQGASPGSAGGVTDRSVAPTSTDFGPVVEDADFVQAMVIPVGPAPSGSSLLAVLAGYVLPGGSGAPPSTLVLFIVLGLILGVSYGAFPRLTERLVAGRLMGASDGHEMAVCRPG